MMQPPQPPRMPDQLAVAAITLAHNQVGEGMGELMQMFEQANQVVQQKSPPPPTDPAVQKTFEAAMAEIQRKSQESQARLQFDMQKAQSADQLAAIQEQNAMSLAAMQEQNAMRIAALQEQTKQQIASMQEASKQQLEQLRQHVETLKNDADNQQHQMTELLKNRDDNQTQIFIEQMKQELASLHRPEAAPDAGILREVQRMLGELEQSKTSEALSTAIEGLRATMEQLGSPKTFVIDAQSTLAGI